MQSIAQTALQNLESSRSLKGRRRPLRLKRPPKFILPRRIENDYYRQMQRILEIAKKQVMDKVLPQLAQWVKEAGIVKDDWRADQWAEKIKRTIESVDVVIGQTVKGSDIKAIAENVARDTSTNNRRELNKQFKQVLGMDIVGGDSTVGRDVAEAFVTENVGYISSITKNYTADVEKTITRSIRAGKRQEEIAATLQDRFSVSESKARLIARDQVSKFNGQLSRVRQTEAGIESYIWRTSLDERVRPEHADREGVSFKWSDPPEDGHPGEPINCRCTAEPDIDSLLEE